MPILKKMAMSTVLGITILGGTSAAIIEMQRRNHEQEWGTVTAPRYQITVSLHVPKQLHAIENLIFAPDEVLGERAATIDDLMKSCTTYHSFDSKKSNYQRELILQAIHDKDLLGRYDPDFLYDHTHALRPNYHFDSVALAQEIGAALIGENLPANLRFVEEKRADKLGGTDEMRSVISYRSDASHIVQVCTIAHELGHLFVQHREENPKKRLIDKDILCIEEAACYAAADAFATYSFRSSSLIAEALKIESERHIVGWAGRFFDEKDNEDRHGKAAAYFLAARMYYKKPHTTFNVLATLPHSSFSDLPKEVHDNIPPLRQRWGQLKRISTSYKLLRNTYLARVEQWANAAVSPM